MTRNKAPPKVFVTNVSWRNFERLKIDSSEGVITMTSALVTNNRLDELTANIKIKLVENKVAANMFNRTVNQNSVEIGQWLTQAKKIVPYKKWQIWLDSNFGMTKQAAGNYIRVAEMVSNLKTGFHFEEFQFAMLIELSRLTPAELQNFLAENPTAETLSKRQLQEKLKQYKTPKNPKQENNTVTVEVAAEIKTADDTPDTSTVTTDKVLKLPAPSFHIVPPAIQAVADDAQINIEINFSRALQLPDSDILLTRFNLSAVKYFSSLASGVIYTAADFTRSDEFVKHLSCCIWYFGGDIQNFADYFSKFGEVIFLQTQKSLSTLTGNVDNRKKPM